MKVDSVNSKPSNRFHLRHAHLNSIFGDDWFAKKAESFARFFGTPIFLLLQTLIVCFWIALNFFGLAAFDEFPFILLNLAFSLQSAYAAPLILLAQTRQADRDKANSIADCEHREDLTHKIIEYQELSIQQNQKIVETMQQNVELLSQLKKMSDYLDTLKK